MNETAFQSFAQWYDGHTAIKHEGEAVWDGGGLLRLSGASGSLDVPFADLEFGEERAGEIVYRRASAPDFRLILPADLPASLSSKLPQREAYGAWVDKLGLSGRNGVGRGRCRIGSQKYFNKIIKNERKLINISPPCS